MKAIRESVSDLRISSKGQKKSGALIIDVDDGDGDSDDDVPDFSNLETREETFQNMQSIKRESIFKFKNKGPGIGDLHNAVANLIS